MAWMIRAGPALRQLEEDIGLDRPSTAQRATRAVFAIIGNTDSFKRIGRVIPEFPAARYRQIWINPGWIYYKATGEDITMLHVRRAESLFHRGLHAFSRMQWVDHVQDDTEGWKNPEPAGCW